MAISDIPKSGVYLIVINRKKGCGKGCSYLVDMVKTKKAKLKKNSCKKFLLGIMDIIILHLVRKRPMSGYDIINHIKDTFAVKISSGTIYPIISKLKKQRLISVNKYGRKTLFCSTKNGDIIRRCCYRIILTYKRILNVCLEKRKNSA